MSDLAHVINTTLGKVGRTTLLTPEVHKAIVDRISIGAFSHVAANAAGIPTSTFNHWIVRGRDEWETHEANLAAGIESEPTDFAALWFDISQARGRARVNAETRVFKDDPGLWLRKGPGRERPGEPGWTDRTEITGANGGPIAVVAGTIDLKRLSDGDLDALEAIALRATPSLPGPEADPSGESPT